ncbi:hypothetical protein OS242_09525 [Tumebacillus sp. DT12]|uniref:DUF4021 domain-containing protein n=1 Tax=Tumebacillus lacus TaxID=2995335 RepID=A0ABT3X324_9BACL|nr:hypothetical protein [Tumebacillus lacus]MCX7570202.1 hypothetical protein [Tumebacillus lacus]
MADKQQNAREDLKENVMLGQDVNVPYDQNVAGEEDTTLWDNMVNAVRPDLTPHFEPKNKQQGGK